MDDDMAITQNDLEILKSEIMADTPDGGGLPTGIAVIDGVSNNLFPDVSDIDRLLGRVRLRKVSLAVKTANAELLQATRMLLTELPDNPNISVFFFEASSFADRRADAQNKIESYLAFGTKWAGHLLETQLAGQRVIQLSLDVTDTVPSVDKPLVLVQNEGQSDEFYQYIRPLKIDVVERKFQRTVDVSVTRKVATIEFGDVLNYTFSGLTVPEFYQNTSTTRRAILREARVADAAKYHSASRLAEPVVAMQSRQVRVESIYTQVVPSTQVETPLLQRDPANQVSAMAGGGGVVALTQSINVSPNMAFALPSGIKVGSLSVALPASTFTDRDGELVDSTGVAIASIKYNVGQVSWYGNASGGQQLATINYQPATEFVRVAQTDYQVVGDNAGYNYVRELGVAPIPNSLRISYSVQGNVQNVHDDGRGNLVDDDGNGRGTLTGKTVLLTTAAIPDIDSYIIYTFSTDLDTVKYKNLPLGRAYHTIDIPDVVSGDITVTWDAADGGADSVATVSNGIVTGDATGTFINGQLSIATTSILAKLSEFRLSYQRVIATDLLSATDILDNPPEGSNGIYEASINFAESITGAEVAVELSGLGNPSIKVVLNIDTSNDKLKVVRVFRRYDAPNGQFEESGFPKTDATWVPMTSAINQPQWYAELVSSAVDKTAGTIALKLKVTRNSSGIEIITRPDVTPIFKATVRKIPFVINRAQVAVTATIGAITEAVTAINIANILHITLPQDAAAPVVKETVFLQIGNDNLSDKDGRVGIGGIDVGNIEYQSGAIALTAWAPKLVNYVTLKTMLRQNDPLPLANIIFRTPVAPLKKASLQISAELADGTQILLTTNDQGNITGNKYAHGWVDFKSGVVALYFYEKLGVTANPGVVNESWYDVTNIYTESATGNTQFINRPAYVKPDSIRYNAIAYSYLPLDKELIGLDPVRLPSDGRVPFVRKGDSIAITELKTMQLPTNAPNDTFDLGFERLSDVNVIDNNGLKVNSDYLNVDLDAGTLQLNGLFDMSFYTAPLTAKYRIMDIALVIETDISGRVTLSTPITHDYSTAAVFSSMLLAGDMQAMAYGVFGQKSWSSVWSDSLIGDATTSQLQVTNNPIVVTNRDAIEERWALVFTSATAFNIIGQTVGQIGTGTTSTLTAPINPMTGYPYFTIPSAAWGTGWSANNVVRINTAAAKYPVWIGNAIQQHQGSSTDNYDFTIGYHANIDRERAV